MPSRWDQNYDRRDVYLITQNALADGTYLDYLRAQYFRSQQHDPPFFSRLFKYVAALGGLANRATSKSAAAIWARAIRAAPDRSHRRHP